MTLSAFALPLFLPRSCQQVVLASSAPRSRAQVLLQREVRSGFWSWEAALLTALQARSRHRNQVPATRPLLRAVRELRHYFDA
jgi:hypothetical protein